MAAMAAEDGQGGCVRSRISQGIQRCPFLRSIVEPTCFTFFPSSYGDVGANGERSPPRSGPIFEDGPAFAMAFELFHGERGAVPLSRKSTSPFSLTVEDAAMVGTYPIAPAARGGDGGLGRGRRGGGGGGEGGCVEEEGIEMRHHWNPLASAGVASISMAGFGGASGRFGWEGLMGLKSRHVASEETKDGGGGDGGQLDLRGKYGASGGGTSAAAAAAAAAGASASAAIATASASSSPSSSSTHEASASDWLQSRCPIAKMHRSFLNFVPLMAERMKPPATMKLCCPAPIVAARAALARTTAVRTLRPKPLSNRVVAVGALCLAVNIPFGVWREHVRKFSPQWFVAIHASIPFIAMLRKALLMPKYAIAFTIATAIIGQTIGSRAERMRLATVGLRAGTLGECVSNYAHGGSVEDGEEGRDGRYPLDEAADADDGDVNRSKGGGRRSSDRASRLSLINAGGHIDRKNRGGCSPPHSPPRSSGLTLGTTAPRLVPAAAATASADSCTDVGVGVGGGIAAAALPLVAGGQRQEDDGRGMGGASVLPLAGHVRRAVVAVC